MSDLAYKLERTIQLTIQQHIDAAREKVVQQAIEEFTRQVREIVGKASVNIANLYSVERMASEIVIRVKIEETK